MHKDTQMSDILHRDDMPDDEKQKFNAYFERFLELRRQKETPSPVKKKRGTASRAAIIQCRRGGTYTQNHASEGNSALMPFESET